MTVYMYAVTWVNVTSSLYFLASESTMPRMPRQFEGPNVQTIDQTCRKRIYMDFRPLHFKY